MGLFSKKEKTHFERDEEGRVIRITHNGREIDHDELKMKTGKQLEQEYYKKHPEKRHPTLRKIGSGMQKLDKKIVEYNRTSNIMNPYATRQVRKPPIMPSIGYTFKHQLSPTRKSPPKKPQYAIVGGKAYPIAGTKKKKKPSKKKPYDPFASWRW